VRGRPTVRANIDTSHLCAKLPAVGTFAHDGHGISLADIDRLAAFPEQNPNLVIETDLDGRVRYLNPVAAARFPGLRDGSDTTLLEGITAFADSFRAEGREFASREVVVGNAVFEQKVCYTAAGDSAALRIYSHDITALKSAERQIAELARRVLHTQEAERHRVARELHDEAGQALAALKISLQLLVAEAPETIRGSLEEAIGLVESTREQIRRVAYGLRPAALDTLGLNRAIEHLCTETSERTHLAVAYQGRDVGPLTDEAEVCLYRFVQEALTNIAVHAKAGRAYVRLTVSGDAVRLRVADDGIGMDAGILDDPVRAGLGIVGMRERLALLSGRLEVTSMPGKGTELVAILPRDLA
jgi:signal transduction histidine kinase